MLSKVDEFDVIFNVIGIIQHGGLIEENNIPLTMLLDDISHLSPTSGRLTQKYQHLENSLKELFQPILNRYQIEADIKSAQYCKFLHRFAMAYIKFTTFAVKKKVTDIGFQAVGVQIPQYDEKQRANGITMKDLWKLYSQALKRRMPDRAKARLSDYSIAVERFINLHSKKPISAITRRDVAEFRNTLERLPARPKLSIRKLTLEKQIEKAEADDLPRIGQANVRKQIQAISSLFSFAQKEGLIDANPAKGVTSDIKKYASSSDENKGYTQDEMRHIFISKLFTENYRPTKADYGEAIYWVPLLLAYTGARVEEIAQLYVADVHLDSPIPYIQLTDERADQSLKTSEKRMVPIHSHLLELGFADYLAMQETAGRLFPKLKQNTIGKYHAAMSKWFGNYIANELKIDRKGIRQFHAFRHSFITACRHYDVAEAIQDSITGHASQAMGMKYGIVMLEKKKEAIEKIPRWF